MRRIPRFLPAIVLGICLLLPCSTALSASRAAGIPGGIVTSRRIVALSFDDGPSAYTPQILPVLHAYRVHATFFEIGAEVAQNPGLTRAVVAAGDEVGNHSYTHPDLAYLPDAAIRSQLEETQATIRAAAGVTPRWIRPPYGAYDSRVAGIASSLGLRPVLWSVDPRDWSLPGTSAIVQRVLYQVRPGSIILLHDGGGNRSETVSALPIILHDLQTEGYQIVTVSRLFGLAPVPACDQARADAWFGAAGVRPIHGHAIYQAWLRRYCAGVNYGPATSGEYALGRDIAQNFARTAHRVEWNRKTDEVGVRIIWSWAAKVFSARGIQPIQHAPITHAWFLQFYKGNNWGPALGAPRSRDGVTSQRFRYGSATERAGKITWARG